MVGGQVLLLELDGNKHISSGGDRENKVTGGHQGRRPSGTRRNSPILEMGIL